MVLEFCHHDQPLNFLMERRGKTKIFKDLPGIW